MTSSSFTQPTISSQIFRCARTRTSLTGLLWTFEPNASGVNLPNPAYAPRPNESFNADANIGHRFAILMANVSALRASRSGAG
jgi:hypothetical protein